ncbi:DUF4188 domain-containing protein [Streptomyces werraensis]|uniref:monooxygenase family protein n=1 Tax=Streptomyces werraensis TaxID=68284 RepID=UPI003415BB13
MAYASPAQAELVPDWRDFNRSVGDSGNVGVWHEACVSRPDRMHVIYRSMPLFGMAKATEHAPPGRRRPGRGEPAPAGPGRRLRGESRDHHPQPPGGHRPGGRPGRRRTPARPRLLLLGLFMSFIEVTAAISTLRAMQVDLGVAPADLSWVSSTYTWWWPPECSPAEPSANATADAACSSWASPRSPPAPWPWP